MYIGSVFIPNPLVLAPMAGVTDLAFRRTCRELGAGLTVTEMVSAKALCYQDKKSIPLLHMGSGESPAAAQHGGDGRSHAVPLGRRQTLGAGIALGDADGLIHQLAGRYAVLG